MSILVGLTGSMGSGKTLAASRFKELGAYILDADSICRDLVQPSKAAWKEIVDHFGSEILLPDRSLDRKKLARIVFENPEQKSALERILHPKVIEEEDRKYREIKAGDLKAVVIIEAALLIESGNYKKTDKVVLIECDHETQIQRLMGAGSWTREEIEKRIRHQMPVEEKVRFADYVLKNHGTVDQFSAQVRSLFQELSQLA